MKGGQKGQMKAETGKQFPQPTPAAGKTIIALKTSFTSFPSLQSFSSPAPNHRLKKTKQNKAIPPAKNKLKQTETYQIKVKQGESNRGGGGQIGPGSRP